jgi:drug/metabolite transporter (DMT)-like permease
MNTAAQMLCGGGVLFAGALAFGERLPAVPGTPAVLALAYLTVMGSLVAFSAYLYLLQTVRPALATSYAYVNPPVAVLIGVAFAGESVHGLDLLAMAVILGGVALIAFARERSA